MRVAYDLMDLRAGMFGRARMDLLCILFDERYVGSLPPRSCHDPNSANWSAALFTLPRNNRESSPSTIRIGSNSLFSLCVVARVLGKHYLCNPSQTTLRDIAFFMRNSAIEHSAIGSNKRPYTSLASLISCNLCRFSNFGQG